MIYSRRSCDLDIEFEREMKVSEISSRERANVSKNISNITDVFVATAASKDLDKVATTISFLLLARDAI